MPKLIDLIKNDLGEPEKRGGWFFWCCPFHNEETPSLGIKEDDDRFKCFGCGKTGGAVVWLMEQRGMTEMAAYAEAGRLGLADGWEHKADQETGAANKHRGHRQPQQKHKAAPQPTAPQKVQTATFDQTAALGVVVECEQVLWEDAGSKARQWLAGRGIVEETARAWRLGYNPRRRDLRGLMIPRGIVIPCFVGDAVQYIKVRRPVPPLPGPKYQQVKGGKAALFGLDHLAGKRVVVICEGELDAVLLWQEAGDLVDVAALGSKGMRPALPWLAYLAGASRWLVALDRDADDAADWWGAFSSRVRRVCPLQGNDLTDFHQAGGDLRAWVSYHLEALADAKPTPEMRPVLEIKADLTALLDEMAEATDQGDDVAEQLLARWDDLNGEYDVAVEAALGCVQ
jgi:DNA primase